jgi:hypothetical protein
MLILAEGVFLGDIGLCLPGAHTGLVLNIATALSCSLRISGCVASAVPIAFLSEHKEPVGMETSQLTPRKYWYCGADAVDDDDDDDMPPLC